ncbi:MAG: universal stress protein [Sphingomonadales bacterium]
MNAWQQIVRPGPAAEFPPEPENAKLLVWEAAGLGVRHASVVACIDRSNMDIRVLAHAQAVARCINADLVLAQVLEHASHAEGPQDPFYWGLKRHQCRERFDWLSQRQPFETAPEEVLLEGKPAEQLASWAADRESTFLVFGTHAETPAGGRGLGSVAQRLIEVAPASLLLVPPTASATRRYARILVPLDGSCRAESVIPTVVAMARAEGAEVLVMHVVPQPQFTRAGPLEPEAVALRRKTNQRNERVARTHVDRVLRYFRSNGVEARSVIMQGDAREQVQRSALDEQVDLIVVATHGESGRADMACGSVTSYLAGHATTALLILRNDQGWWATGARRLQEEYRSVPLRQSA